MRASWHRVQLPRVLRRPPWTDGEGDEWQDPRYSLPGYAVCVPWVRARCRVSGIGIVGQ